MSAICFSFEYFLVIFVIISIPDGNARYASGYNHPIHSASRYPIYIYVREYNTRGLLRNRDAFALIKNYFDQVGSIARSSNIEDVIKKNIEIDRLSRPIFIQF